MEAKHITKLCQAVEYCSIYEVHKEGQGIAILSGMYTTVLISEYTSFYVSEDV